MRRCDTGRGSPTLDIALSELMGVDDLKNLAALTKAKLPTRKADLARMIRPLLAGDVSRAVRHGLDELQGAAVNEVVHSCLTEFQADRFDAEYGRSSVWGETNEYGNGSCPPALGFFFYRVRPSTSTSARSSASLSATRTARAFGMNVTSWRSCSRDGDSTPRRRGKSEHKDSGPPAFELKPNVLNPA